MLSGVVRGRLGPDSWKGGTVGRRRHGLLCQCTWYAWQQGSKVVELDRMAGKSLLVAATDVRA
jgi:hypothetical protein